MIIKLIQNKIKIVQGTWEKSFSHKLDKLSFFRAVVNSLRVKANIFYLILLSLFLFHFVNNIIIILKDSTPFGADASGYYSRNYFYIKAILKASRSFDLTALGAIFKSMPLNGQLLVFIAAPFYFILGISHDTAVISNQIFFLVLIASIFGIGKELFNNTIGLLAAFIISFYPAVFGFSRIYMLEFPILAISTLGIYLLIKSDGFKHRKYAIYFGLACGLGVLLRPRFLVYVVVPIIFYIFKNLVYLFKKQKGIIVVPARQILGNFLLWAVFLCISILPWYSLEAVYKYVDYQKIWSSLPYFSNIIPTFLQYLQILFRLQLHWFFLFLFLVSLIISFFNKDKMVKVYFLLAWFIFSFVILCSFGLKYQARLIVPLSSPIALITAVGLEKFRKRKLSRYVLYILLFLSVAQYFYISYSPMIGKKMHAAVKVLNNESPRSYFGDIFSTHGLLSANNDDWKTEEIFSSFDKRRNYNRKFKWEFANSNKQYLVTGRPLDAQDASGIMRILYIGFRGTPIHNGIEERILFNNLPIAIIGFYPDDFDYKNLFSMQDIQHIVSGADYVVRFKVEPIKSDIISQVNNIFDANINNFEKLHEIVVPWGECEIYGAKIKEHE